MKKAEQEEIKRLRDSEEKYRKMFQLASDAIFNIDTETGTIAEANLKAEEMTGYSLSELQGMKAWELHPEYEREKAIFLFEKVRSDESQLSYNLSIRKKDGTLIETDINAATISYGNKKIIQRICRDITDRRLLEERNKYLKEYFEHTLNMMPVGLGVIKNINKNPEVEFENKKLKEMFSQSGKKGSGGFRWYDRSAQNIVKRVVFENGAYAEERICPGGKIYLFMASYFRTDENNWNELQVIQDVTQQRKMENQLHQAKEKLEEKVRERTRELQEKQSQLIQAEKMASLGQLVAGVAHEINTPLGALKSNIGVFSSVLPKMEKMAIAKSSENEEPVNEQLENFFQKVMELNTVNQTAIERIVSIVNSLRNFARLDEAEQKKADIHEGLESTITLIQHKMKGRIEIIKEYGSVPLIECFPNQLNQVFMNLLVNAVQSIEDKGKIWIKTFIKNETVIVEFRDTGKGIPVDKLDKIFDPGYTTKGAGVGTGLGLSIVYQIIKNHKGNIEVESKVGEGTVFRINLPVR